MPKIVESPALMVLRSEGATAVSRRAEISLRIVQSLTPPAMPSLCKPPSEPESFHCAHWVLVCAFIGATTVVFSSGCERTGAPPARPSRDVIAADSQSPPPPISSRGVLNSIADIELMTTDFDRRAGLYALLQAASVNEIRRLLDDADTVMPAPKRLSLKYVIYSRFGAIDGKRAVHHARHDSDAVHALYWAFAAWAETDLEAALLQAHSMSRRDRSIAYHAILRAHHDLEPSLRDKYAEQLSVPRFSQEHTRLYALALEDPQSAWAQAMETATPNKRNVHLWNVAKAWIQVDPMAAMQAVESADGKRMPVHWRHALLEDWAEANPREALNWAMSRPASKGTTALLGAVLGAIAAVAPQDALVVATTLSGAARDAAYQKVLDVWADRDPRSAAAWFDTSAHDPKLDLAVGIAERFAQKHPDEALDWSLALSADHRVRATKSVVASVLDDSPTKAAQLVLRIEETDLQLEATIVLLRSWVAADPTSATRWIERLQDKAARLFAYNAAFHLWARSDFPSAAHNADRVVGVAERHEAIRAVLRALDVQDPPDFRLLKRLHNRLPKEKRLPGVDSYLNQGKR